MKKVQMVFSSLILLALIFIYIDIIFLEKGIFLDIVFFIDNFSFIILLYIFILIFLIFFNIFSILFIVYEKENIPINIIITLIIISSPVFFLEKSFYKNEEIPKWTYKALVKYVESKGLENDAHIYFKNMKCIKYNNLLGFRKYIEKKKRLKEQEKINSILGLKCKI